MSNTNTGTVALERSVELLKKKKAEKKNKKKKAENKQQKTNQKRLGNSLIVKV